MKIGQFRRATKLAVAPGIYSSSWKTASTDLPKTLASRRPPWPARGVGAAFQGDDRLAGDADEVGQVLLSQAWASGSQVADAVA